uniref:Exonuclease 1 n=1 Tax=Leersia perrieri TaxID=77586 RepID=A0A0D9V6F7_9ORYZ
MGIQGLLPQLKSIMAPIGVEALKGQTVAVDTYSWLHKGALSCGDRLCKGLPTTRVNMLRHHGVKPILVFDGGHLPMKSDQETKRERSRKENLERAKEHESAGNSRAAFECYQKAVDITPRIAFELIQVLKQEKVDYIVAPYEADAQMAFLSVNKLVDAVITEDSDLIPFGCSRIIFKMDRFGQGVEFHITRLQRSRELDLNGFTKQMLLEMCILSGCDYLPSLPGMGVKRAHALIQKLKSHEKVIKHLRYSAVSVPPEYEENFRKAIWAFQFQRVYDPVAEDISVAKGIALGNIDPITKEPFEAKKESSAPAFDKVHMIRESTVPSNGKKRLDLPVQRNFRAPKVTPKQQILNGSVSSPRIEDSCTPDSIEDTCLPSNNIQVSQCSSEHFSSGTPLDDSINTTSQCSSERVLTDFPQDDSASISPQCTSRDIDSDPSEDPGKEDTKVEINYCSRSTIPAGSLEGIWHGISDSVLDSHNTEPSRTAPHYAEKSVVSADRNITVKSSYFKTVNKRVYTNQGEDEFHDEDNCETANCTFPGDQLKSSGDILKRRKFSDPQKFEDEMFQPTSSHESPLVVDQDCDTDSVDGVNANAEGKFGCNVSHVNKYSGIAEKSMDQFAALISSFRYAGSRASGLRAPLKDVKNTLPVRSVLRPPEQRFSRTAKKTTRVSPLQSRFSSDATNNSTDVPDLSTFAYRPTTTASVYSDQGKITHKAADAADVPPDLRTFAYAPTRTATSHFDQSKNASKAMCTTESPPDLSTFAYKPMKSAVRRSDGSKFSGAKHKAAGRTSWS